MESTKVFLKYNDEGIIIGRLLVAYADLELSLFHCVNVTRDDFDTVDSTVFTSKYQRRKIF